MTEPTEDVRPRRGARLARGQLEPRSRPGRMAQQADRLRLGRADLAEGLVRPRPAGGARRRRRPRRSRRIGAVGVARAGVRNLAAATLLAHGTDFQKEQVPAPQPDRRGHLVPAVQRARQRLRPRRRRDPRRAQGRPLGDQRPEGLDHQRPPRRLGPAAGAHRLGRAQAPGAVLLHPRHAPAGRRGAAAAPDERPRLVQPGVLHRRRGRRPSTWSARSAAAGRWRRRR